MSWMEADGRDDGKSFIMSVLLKDGRYDGKCSIVSLSWYRYDG